MRLNKTCLLHSDLNMDWYLWFLWIHCKAFMGPSINIFWVTNKNRSDCKSLICFFSSLCSYCLTSSLVFRWLPLVASLDTSVIRFQLWFVWLLLSFSVAFVHVVMLFGRVVFPQQCAHSLDLVASSQQVLLPCVVKCLKRLHACNIECFRFQGKSQNRPWICWFCSALFSFPIFSCFYHCFVPAMLAGLR